MRLLKEYIKLIVEEIIKEDIAIGKLSPQMIGIYAFAQAINKLIYKGEALPGAVPIDIIDAGEQLKSAPMATKTERVYGLSFQSSGNSFKLYLDPRSNVSGMSSSNETHDIVHAFTGHLAKAFGRRRQSVEKSGRYKISPSRFNKITIDRKVEDQINSAFKNYFDFDLDKETFTKPFTMRQKEYEEWFEQKHGKYLIDQDVVPGNVSNMAHHIHQAVHGNDFSSGVIGKKHYAKYPGIEKDFDFSDYKLSDFPTSPFEMDPDTQVYNPSTEDEEELGNKMNDAIRDNVSEGKKIENPKQIVDTIMKEYNESFGLISSEEQKKNFKHRYDTPEVRTAMIRLFELYNEFLDRYKKIQSNLE